MKFNIVHIIRGAGFDIRMDRLTPFGNPFMINLCNSRDNVCDKFDEYLEENPDLMKRFNTIVRTLSNRKEINLGCWCAPERCHVQSYVDRYGS